MDWILIAILAFGPYPVVTHGLFPTEEECERVKAEVIAKRPNVRIKCIPNAPAE